MKIPMVGEVYRTYQNCEVVVLKYVSCSNIHVKFLDGSDHEKIVATKELKNGSIKNPFYPAVRGVGFFGVGPYTAKSDKDSTITTKEYVHWSSMLTRCYYPGYHDKYPTYAGCNVDKQWYNFQEFAEWCQWQVGFGSGVLDKDLLYKGNKVYGPETCVFIPKELNGLIVSQNTKGKETPPGISYQESYNKYIVSCAINGKNKNLGRYKCPEEAFAVYKEFKEQLVRSKAEEYKDRIDIRAYAALSNFTV